VKPWTYLVWDPAKKADVKIPRLFYGEHPIDKAGIWKIYFEFHNKCLQNVDFYGGILKAVAK
jgi:hypothetical protein